ncbi:P22 phage major capsid protein family protein [Verrucomicrobiota bacterium sgz303538]
MAISAAAGLKLDKVLQTGLTALKRRLAVLTLFSHVYQAKEVPRGKSIHVPFVPLEALASKDFDPAVGYEEGDFNIEEMPVQIQYRKYQPFSYTSEQLVGLSEETLNQAMVQKTDKLGADIIAHVLGGVNLANFGAAPLAAVAASVYDTDDVFDMDGALTAANWPTVGRSLVLDSTYCTNIKKDPSIKNAAASGSTAGLREGSIGRVAGFDIDEVPNLPENGEKLAGFAALPYAILLASAPIAPAPAVKAQLFDYREAVDKDSGLTLVYRHWADPTKDREMRTIEVGYGFAKGDVQQLKRIVKP